MVTTKLEEKKTKSKRNESNFFPSEPSKFVDFFRYDWDVYQLHDYADALLSMMPRTVFSRHREKNNSKSSW